MLAPLSFSGDLGGSHEQLAVCGQAIRCAAASGQTWPRVATIIGIDCRSRGWPCRLGWPCLVTHPACTPHTAFTGHGWPRVL